jgi:hypothetical protein
VFLGAPPLLAPALVSMGPQVVPLVVSLLSGLTAGVVATVFSQPADVILTRLAQVMRLRRRMRWFDYGDCHLTHTIFATSLLWMCVFQDDRGLGVVDTAKSLWRGDDDEKSNGGLAPFFVGVGPRSIWAGEMLYHRTLYLIEYFQITLPCLVRLRCFDRVCDRWAVLFVRCFPSCGTRFTARSHSGSH